MQIAIPEIDGATEPFVFGGIPSRGVEPAPLEDRCLPATINTWAATIGPPSNWNNSLNWSLGHVPTGSEIATFNSTSQTFCFVDAPVAGTNAVSGINISSQYGGQIQDAADLVIGTDGFVQTGGVFFVPGSTTITDAGNWSEISPFGFNAGPGATVDFNSATSQTILDDNTQFFNLTHSGAGPTIRSLLSIGRRSGDRPARSATGRLPRGITP